MLNLFFPFLFAPVPMPGNRIPPPGVYMYRRGTRRFCPRSLTFRFSTMAER